jgi:hypothetical protein
MTKLSSQKALYILAVVFFGFAASGMAQEAGATSSGPTLNCSGGAPCPDPSAAVQVMGTGPVIGAGPLGVVSTGGMAVAIPDNADLVKNQPYQAQAVTEIKQALADGTHITQTTTAAVARDSDGRTVRIQKLSTIGPWKSSSDSSQAGSPTLTTIFDPIAKTHTDFMSDMKVAHVLPLPPLLPGVGEHASGGFAVVAGGPMPITADAEMGPVTLAVQGHAESPLEANGPNPPDVKTESLGTKTIEGITATGTKTTSIIPSGTIGNDKELVISRETWYSPDLRLVIQSTQTDPRFGTTTYTLTNIQRSEPDPTLFQVPAGYKVEKVPVFVQPH